MKKQFAALTLTLALAATSCGMSVSPVVELVAKPKPASSDYKDRQNFTIENLVSDEFYSALDDFADKTAAILNKEGNVNYSPTSLYLALALAKLGGADDPGLTKLLGIEKFDGITFESDPFYNDQPVKITVPSGENAALADQCRKFMNLNTQNGEYTEIDIANSIWSSAGIKKDFAEIAARNLYAESFESNDPKAQKEWISKHTKGTLSPDIENQLLELISIINTVYFKAEWADRFDKSKNEKATFHSPNADVEAEFMVKHTIGGFRRGENFTIAGRGFKDSGSMMIVLPDEGTGIRSLIEEYGLTGLLAAGESKSGYINWFFPKFGFRTEFSVRSLISDLGAGGIFGENAGMAKNITDFEPMTISEIRQGSYIAVDEKGVTASAYTDIAYAGCPMPVDTADMRMDRPFLYAIYYKNALLFVGIVDNPTA